MARMSGFLLLFAAATASATDPSALDAIKKFNDIKTAVDMLQQEASSCFNVQLDHSGKNYLLSDTLVKNLSCANLNVATLLKSLQPTAFSPDKQFPVQNWSSGTLAQCWALALSQREFFYLARFGVDGAKKTQKANIVYGLDIAHGTADPLKTFNIQDKGLSEEKDFWPEPTPFMSALSAGIPGRSFQSEIEARQEARFYSAGNLGMVFGSRDRDTGTNQETMNTVLSDTSEGRMPLLILRAELTAQHAILVKKVTKSKNGTYTLTCYDSNQPTKEATMQYKDGEFYAPNIVGLFAEDGSSPVGVFLQDEDDMDRIQEAVFEHYRATCKGVTALAKKIKN